MVYQFHDNSGAVIDAHFEVQSGQLILHSRGGSRNSSNARNTAYNRDLLRMIIERIRSAKLTLSGIWVDSERVQNLPLKQRQIFFPEKDQRVLPEVLVKKLSERMVKVGQVLGTIGGNPTKRLLFAFTGNPSDEWIARVVRTTTSQVTTSREVEP